MMNYQTCKYRQWTQGAVECYARNCVCNGCDTYELIGDQCKMKAAVISLVQDIGLPPKDFDIPLNNKNMVLQDEIDEDKEMIKIETKNTKVYDKDLDYTYGKSYATIIEAIKKGHKTNPEIAEYTGIDKNFLSVKYRDFCTTLLQKGLFDNLSGTTYLEKIINFVQKRMNKSENANAQNINIEQFTAREQEIVNLLVSGLNYREVCKKLVITMATFKCHLANIYSKRDYHSLQDLIIAESKNKTDNIDIPITKKTDSDKIKQLEEENAELKKRIETLENQPKPCIDFDEIRHKIQTEIDMLQAKLNALELLEKEL